MMRPTDLSAIRLSLCSGKQEDMLLFNFVECLGFMLSRLSHTDFVQRGFSSLAAFLSFRCYSFDIHIGWRIIFPRTI